MVTSSRDIENQDAGFNMEARIEEWKTYLAKHAAIDGQDIDELEGHLRDQVDELRAAGLDEDEAFLVATKRIGNLNAVSREYAEVHSGRLWRNLVLADGVPGLNFSRELMAALLFAVAAAISIKLPALFGIGMEDDAGAWFYQRNITLFSLPFLGAFFIWKRELGFRGLQVLAIGILIAAVTMNVYPLEVSDSTAILAFIHLPLVFWFVIGVLYTGDWWQSQSRRMDFIRFSGEYAIYYVLIALGGAVLTAFTLGMFAFIDIDVEWLVQTWVIPCGAVGAVVIAAWLVEAKQAAIENMAPVLTRVFTPLFTILLMAFLITMSVTGKGFDLQREVLIGLDLMLVLVLGLVLYAVSSRDPAAPPGIFDLFQLLLVVAALLVDVLALLAIAGRISEMGFTPNRVAALGENLVLLVSLSGYAWLYLRFLRRQAGFTSLERWQTNYIPVYVIWALIVVVAFPPLFGFV
ncbi:permease prefix domain 1-containing protein [Pseudidiomarina salinarum]|nr:permease prefix domain 1-containing protein [Pseudidiomarina salinarum]RUO71314.1 hypothetical protein CWI79_07780 [Pseudidiomarina salinarum]